MAILTEEDRLSYRIGFLVGLVALLAVPVMAVRIVATLVVLCYVPAAPFAARAGTPLPASLALVVTVSPLMIGLPVMVVVLLGLPVMTAVWAIVGIAMAQFLVYGTQRSFVSTPSERRLLLALAAVFAVAAILSLWLPVTNTWWRMREDSWFHAAVFNRIAMHGLPVADPYFSPIRLQYMYFYHIVLLTISTLTGLDPFGAMIVANLMALGGCVLGLDFLASRFAHRPAARVAAVVLGIFALNGLFYAFFPIRVARAMFGETSGLAILRHFFALSPPGHETASRFLAVEGNQFLFLDKFMVGTALSLTLGLVCVALALIAAMREDRWNWILSYFYVAALCGVMFLHLIIGLAVFVATAAVIAVEAVSRRGSPGRRRGLSSPRHAALTAVAAAVTIPYIMNVLPRESAERSIRLALQSAQVVGVVAGVLAVLVPALWYLARTARARGDAARRAVAVWALAVAAMALIVDLPTTNETKFVFPLHLALVGLAAGALEVWLSTSGRRRTACVAYLLLCAVPVNAVYFACASADETRFEVTQTEQALYEWIRTTTDEDALFLEGGDVVRIPVLAARDQYWGTEVYARNWNYPDSEIAPRRALRDSVFYGGGPDAEVLAHAASLERPMYVVLRDIHADGGKRFRMFAASPYLEGKYMTESIAVFEVRFNPPDE